MPASVSVALEVGAEEVAVEDVLVKVDVGKTDVMDVMDVIDVVLGSIARWNVNCDQDLEETL